MVTRLHLTFLVFVACFAPAITPATCQGLWQAHSEMERGQCWSPAELAEKTGEKISHRAPYNAAIEPKGAAADYSPVAAGLRGSIRRVELPKGEKLIALTFDLCETEGEISGYDGQIIDTLRAAGAKATFFASGKWLLDHRERAEQLLADPLFQVGAHSWTHKNYRLLSETEIQRDLALDMKADADMRQELGAKACFNAALSTGSRSLERVSLFRFPFGTCDAESMKRVNDAGLVAIQWDVVSADPSPAQSAEAIRRGVVGAAKSGSIVVMHGNGRGRHTAEALPEIIADLRKRGFEFATVGELLSKGRPVTAESCYELKPGDNLRYDRLFPLTHPARNAAAETPLLAHAISPRAAPQPKQEH